MISSWSVHFWWCTYHRANVTSVRVCVKRSVGGQQTATLMDVVNSTTYFITSLVNWRQISGLARSVWHRLLVAVRRREWHGRGLVRKCLSIIDWQASAKSWTLTTYSTRMLASTSVRESMTWRWFLSEGRWISLSSVSILHRVQVKCRPQ